MTATLPAGGPGRGHGKQARAPGHPPRGPVPPRR